ncbi:hypothetical protein DFH05DRAFT_1399118, partial [Lentinula detonsa]
TQKLERRLQIAAAMIRISEALANNEQCDCWTRILDSISQLGTMGMSDDEQILDTQGQHGIVVYSPTFRHSQFDELFNKVDSIRGLEKYLFTRVGRNRLPRIRGYEGVERSPPANLPSSFYQPSYLEAMKKGVVNVVAISKEKTTIPRCVLRQSLENLDSDSSQKLTDTFGLQPIGISWSAAQCLVLAVRCR